MRVDTVRQYHNVSIKFQEFPYQHFYNLNSRYLDSFAKSTWITIMTTKISNLFKLTCNFHHYEKPRVGLTQQIFIRGGSAPRFPPPPLPLYRPFFRKRYPFRIPSIDKWYPFYIPCLELCIPFNYCKCTLL